MKNARLGNRNSSLVLYLAVCGFHGSQVISHSCQQDLASKPYPYLQNKQPKLQNVAVQVLKSAKDILEMRPGL